MKLLLTGPPRAGKTTVVQQVIASEKEAFWVTSAEIRDENNGRTGFSAETSTGLSATFAHKEAISSGTSIGDYKVDIQTVDRLFTEPIRAATHAGQFLIIDEIGRMQMLSSRFAEAVRDLFVSDCDLLATIRYGDAWTEEFIKRADVLTLVLTPENREQSRRVIEAVIATRPHLNKLNNAQQLAATALAKQYADSGDFTRLRKLYHNAVRYAAERKVAKEGDTYIVAGDHASHRVPHDGSHWRCDCDLFHDRNHFTGKAGECSHIQAAKLSLKQ